MGPPSMRLRIGRSSGRILRETTYVSVRLAAAYVDFLVKETRGERTDLAAVVVVVDVVMGLWATLVI